MLRRIRPAGLVLLLLLPLVVVLSSAVGCPKDPYTASMAGSDGVSNAVADALSALPNLTSQQILDVSQQRAFLTRCSQVTSGNQSFRAAVLKIHQSGAKGSAQYIVAAQAFVQATTTQQVGQLPPTAQIFLEGIDTAITSIEVAISNSKGATPAGKGGQ